MTPGTKSAGSRAVSYSLRTYGVLIALSMVYPVVRALVSVGSLEVGLAGALWGVVYGVLGGAVIAPVIGTIAAVLVQAGINARAHED